jgi:hypothetical protein
VCYQTICKSTPQPLNSYGGISDGFGAKSGVRNRRVE